MRQRDITTAELRRDLFAALAMLGVVTLGAFVVAALLH
jgi:hypothetical protein